MPSPNDCNVRAVLRILVALEMSFHILTKGNTELQPPSLRKYPIHRLWLWISGISGSCLWWIQAKSFRDNKCSMCQRSFKEDGSLFFLAEHSAQCLCRDACWKALKSDTGPHRPTNECAPTGDFLFFFFFFHFICIIAPPACRLVPAFHICGVHREQETFVPPVFKSVPPHWQQRAMEQMSRSQMLYKPWALCTRGGEYWSAQEDVFWFWKLHINVLHYK